MREVAGELAEQHHILRALPAIERERIVAWVVWRRAVDATLPSHAFHVRPPRNAGGGELVTMSLFGSMW